ncbi:MAG: tripartite tricarboxylate transporter substrate binding protein [Proteobacteria bacterium]|nr:tripartite tricarboxylate transporter substrate binding protein [Burkholderiales bacterium]
MKRPKSCKRLAAPFVSLVGSSLLCAGVVQAQPAFPSQPIRIIVPFPAGGGTDLTARLVAEPMRQALGVSIVVENRAGASGMIGTAAVAKAKPDGYTLLVNSGEVAVNPHLYKPMSYDWETDLTPVTLLVRVPNVLAVNPDVPAKTVAELIAYAKEHPGKLTFSSSGVGNPQQLTGELFNKMAGVRIVHVPYKGAAPQIADVVGKHITMTFVSIGAALPFIEGGRMRALGVTSSTRVSALPNVPPLADTPALAGFEVVNFFGMLAPAGTPAAQIKTIHAAAVQALRVPDVAGKLRDSGFEPSPMSPDQFREFIRAESAKFGRIIVEANVKIEQ